ncbi:CLUMA_CG001337, isoform A [Clunio marinus]|uniref:CLUMA_CG001337, isoform A n=1 Tax=Clunio marinus TaxID=568069 RepID=A0A1J1HMS4_9DIPT|nr:CLUMA_CG001337, isoform A [Clunio marinus]
MIAMLNSSANLSMDSVLKNRFQIQIFLCASVLLQRMSSKQKLQKSDSVRKSFPFGFLPSPYKLMTISTKHSTKNGIKYLKALSLQMFPQPHK